MSTKTLSCFSRPSLTCLVQVVSGQLKQTHVHVGGGVKGATGQEDDRDPAPHPDSKTLHLLPEEKKLKQKTKLRKCSVPLVPELKRAISRTGCSWSTSAVSRDQSCPSIQHLPAQEHGSSWISIRRTPTHSASPHTDMAGPYF